MNTIYFYLMGALAGAVGGYFFAQSAGAVGGELWGRVAMFAVMGALLFGVLGSRLSPPKGEFFQNISAEQAAEMLAKNDSNVVFIDVRTPSEVAGGYIAGTRHFIDISSAAFPARIAQLDKEKTYVVYCRSGNRSARACAEMEGQGFRKLYNVLGGVGAWQGELQRK